MGTERKQLALLLLLMLFQHAPHCIQKGGDTRELGAARGVTRPAQRKPDATAAEDAREIYEQGRQQQQQQTSTRMAACGVVAPRLIAVGRKERERASIDGGGGGSMKNEDRSHVGPVGAQRG